MGNCQNDIQELNYQNSIIIEQNNNLLKNFDFFKKKFNFLNNINTNNLNNYLVYNIENNNINTKENKLTNEKIFQEKYDIIFQKKITQIENLYNQKINEINNENKILINKFNSIISHINIQNLNVNKELEKKYLSIQKQNEELKIKNQKMVDEFDKIKDILIEVLIKFENIIQISDIQNEKKLLNKYFEDSINIETQIDKKENELKKESEESIVSLSNDIIQNEIKEVNINNEDILVLKQNYLHKLENDLLNETNKFKEKNKKKTKKYEPNYIKKMRKKIYKIKEEINNIQSWCFNSKLALIGLKNIGNNCYINSVIQNLKNISKFTYKLLKFETSDKFLISYQDLLKKLINSKDNYIDPTQFKNQLGIENDLFAGDNEYDSTIFYLSIIELLHNKLNTVKENEHVYCDMNELSRLNEFPEEKYKYFINNYLSNNKSFMIDIFYGFLRNETICSNCKKGKYTFQSFTMLDFPIVNITERINSLKECFEIYQKSKDKSNQKGYTCKICNLNKMYSQTKILKIPPIIVINLKRVGDNQVYYHNITIPFELNMNSLIKNNIEDKNNIYELIGFIKHIGDNISGHNFSFCKNMFDNKWYEYNDSHVSEVKNDIPSTENAFLFFYQKKGFKELDELKYLANYNK